ncbi:MAG: hypothetical protein HQ557_06395 [Bacteroidetes bacterium]|nr:hypothetical protein [Bacteroidota bacterium]
MEQYDLGFLLELCRRTAQIVSKGIYQHLQQGNSSALIEHFQYYLGRLCMQFCEHCAGLIHPVIRKHGFFPIYDIISPTEPRCHFRAYRDRKLAVAFSKQARKLWDPYDDLLSV